MIHVYIKQQQKHILIDCTLHTVQFIQLTYSTTEAVYCFLLLPMVDFLQLRMTLRRSPSETVCFVAPYSPVISLDEIKDLLEQDKVIISVNFTVSKRQSLKVADKLGDNLFIYLLFNFLFSLTSLLAVKLYSHGLDNSVFPCWAI